MIYLQTQFTTQLGQACLFLVYAAWVRSHGKPQWQVCEEELYLGLLLTPGYSAVNNAV